MNTRHAWCGCIDTDGSRFHLPITIPGKPGHQYFEELVPPIKVFKLLLRSPISGIITSTTIILHKIVPCIHSSMNIPRPPDTVHLAKYVDCEYSSYSASQRISNAHRHLSHTSVVKPHRKKIGALFHTRNSELGILRSPSPERYLVTKEPNEVRTLPSATPPPTRRRQTGFPG